MSPGPGPTRMRCSGSTGCRSSTSRTAISRCAGVRRKRRTAMCWFSTARSTTTSNCVRNCRPPTAPCSPPTATARPSSPPTTTGAPTRWPGCAACSRSRCGIRKNANCSAPVTRSASSRCSWRSGRVAPRWAVRRNACSSLPMSPVLVLASTSAQSSTTPCCNTCPSRRRCTAACAGWNRAATHACGPASPLKSRVISPPGSTPRRSPRAASRAATTRSPRCWRIRSPSTCAPTSPSVPFYPGGSTPRRSPRWRCGTTRG